MVIASKEKAKKEKQDWQAKRRNLWIVRQKNKLADNFNDFDMDINLVAKMQTISQSYDEMSFANIEAIMPEPKVEVPAQLEIQI